MLLLNQFSVPSNIFIQCSYMKLVSMESEDERKAFITDNIEYLGQLTLDTFNICVEKFDRS